MTGTHRPAATIWAARALIVVAVLALWEFVPKIESLQDVSPLFDPFFVSSPSMIWERIVDLMLGRNGQPSVWPYLWKTVLATFLGLAIGTVLGAAMGLLLSNNETTQRIVSPFIAVVNATPRVALIPIFVIIAGPTLTTSVLTAVVIVVFIVFYNAYAGGASVPAEVVQNAKLLGATPREVMRRVRLPYVLVWTFTSLPNAISFGLVAVVTAEILMGRIGMGRLLADSLSNVDATLTFAVVVMLSIFGVVIVTLSQAVERRALHWWRP